MFDAMRSVSTGPGMLEGLAGSLGSIGNFMSGLGGIAGAFGGSDDNGIKKSDYNFTLKKNREYSRLAFDDRMRSADKWGLHRLYAMGAPAFQAGGLGSSSGGGPGPDLAAAGQALQRIGGQEMSEQERQLHDLNMQAIQAGINKDNAQALYWASEAARDKQGNKVTAPAAPNANVVSSSLGLAAKPGMVEATPSKSVSADPNDSGTEAGTSPAFKFYDFGAGMGMWLPASELGEAAEGLGEIGQTALVALPTIARNALGFGQFLGRGIKRNFRRAQRNNPKYRGSPTRRGGYAK